MMFSVDLFRESSPRLAKTSGAVDRTVPTEPHVSKKQSESKDPPLFGTILGSCGGFMETASLLLLGPSDCMSCIDESLRTPAHNPRSPRTMKRSASSRARLKLAQKLKDSPSREGEVVDVPIKLVKSNSGGVKKDDSGQVYDPYRSFDDSISAISAHTLDEMARRYPKPLMESLNAGKGSRPRNGDELTPPNAQRISSDSSDESRGEKDQMAPHDEIDDGIPFRRNFDEPPKPKSSTPTYELIENEVPYIMTRPKRRKNLGKSRSRASQKKPDAPIDAHLAPTPKARGKKSKRKTSKQASLEPLPLVAEI